MKGSEIELRLSDQNVVLDSFIVSNTPSREMTKLWGVDKPAMQKLILDIKADVE